MTTLVILKVYKNTTHRHDTYDVMSRSLAKVTQSFSCNAQMISKLYFMLFIKIGSAVCEQLKKKKIIIQLTQLKEKQKFPPGGK